MMCNKKIPPSLLAVLRLKLLLLTIMQSAYTAYDINFVIHARVDSEVHAVYG